MPHATDVLDIPRPRTTLPRIGAVITGGNDGLTVASLPLLQVKAPHYFEVTDSEGCDQIIRPEGDGWALVAPVNPVEEPAPEIAPDIEQAPPRKRGRPRLAEVNAIKAKHSHITLDEARLKYQKAMDGSDTDKIWNAFLVYTEAVEVMNGLDPAFYEGRRA